MLSNSQSFFDYITWVNSCWSLQYANDQLESLQNLHEQNRWPINMSINQHLTFIFTLNLWGYCCAIVSNTFRKIKSRWPYTNWWWKLKKSTISTCTPHNKIIWQSIPRLITSLIIWIIGETPKDNQIKLHKIMNFQPDPPAIITILEGYNFRPFSAYFIFGKKVGPINSNVQHPGRRKKRWLSES